MPAAVKEIKIQTSTAKDFGIGSLEVSVQMDQVCEKDVSYLWAQLIDGNGAEVDRIFPVPAEGTVQFCMQAEKPVLWNAEDPYLYELVLELRDTEKLLLGCTMKKIAFYRWEEQDGVYLLNGKDVKQRIFECDLPRHAQECEIRTQLKDCKRQHGNTVIIPKEKRTALLHELCLEYGIYLLCEENAEALKLCRSLKEGAKRAEGQEAGQNPDFELNVNNQGVLIENKSTFINAGYYELLYQMKRENGMEIVEQGTVFVDVPAGTSRYVELPFERPKEAGTYLYRAALCMKEKTPWADRGDEVAVSVSRIANLFCG